MSIVLMSAAFKAPIKATPKLVLLALCDCANDQGECYPSVPTLMEKCSAAERTVQDALNFLAREGYLSREFRTGRSTVYWIADPRKWRTPAVAAPPQQPHPTPAFTAPPPPQTAHPTPAVAAPITVIEPSIEPSRNQKTTREQVALSDLVADGLTEQTAEEWLAHRKRKRALLTPRAWADVKSEAAKAGWGLEDAIGKALGRGWTGLEAAWLAKEAAGGGMNKQEALEARNRAVGDAWLRQQKGIWDGAQ